MRLSRVVAVALVATLWAPGAARGQAPAPLTKAELVRALSTRAYPADELAELIRASCVSFEPTARDLADLTSLGASDEVLAAVGACRTEPLVVTLDPARVTVPAGGRGWVEVRASQGSRPVAGLRLHLGGTAATGGNPLAAMTDALGRASFSIPAGRTTRSYRLPVRVPGRELADPPTLTMDVVADLPIAARLSPPYLFVDPERDTVVSVLAVVTDGFGNPVVGQAVTWNRSDGGAEVARGVTDEQGNSEMHLRGGALPTPGAVVLYAGGRALGEVTVEPRVVADETMSGPPPDATGESAEDEGTEDVADRPATPVATGESAENEGTEDVADRPATPVAAGDRADSLALYRDAVARSPDDVELRLGLARQLERTGRLGEAEREYREVVRRTPGGGNSRARRELALLLVRPSRVELGVFGGATLDNDSADPAVRAASASLRLLRGLRLWARYDRSLGLDPLPLDRGPQEIEGGFGGLEARWGVDGRLVTRVEVGRRRFESVPLPRATDATASPETRNEDLALNVARVEQRVVFPVGVSFGSFAAGGYVGRWFDRDDWFAYAQAGFPIGGAFSVSPAVYVGETVGRVVPDEGRVPEREIRGVLPITYRSLSGWLIEPGFAVGRVTSEVDALGGTLYEGRLLIEVPVAGPHRVRLFGRHQAAPGSERFTLVAAGLLIRVR